MYLAEFTRFNNEDISKDGFFEYPYFDVYWTEKDRHPYFIKKQDIIIGFCLVNTYTEELKSGYSIAEFYILPIIQKTKFGKNSCS